MRQNKSQFNKKNQYIELCSQLYFLWGKKQNGKPNPVIQTLVYRSNRYYYKIYEKRNSKSNSLTLHLDTWTRYFKHRYSIKLSRTQIDLKIIKPYQCSLERSHSALIELCINSNQGLCLFRRKQMLTSSRQQFTKPKQ